MPAETHQRSDSATLDDVLLLLCSELGIPHDASSGEQSLDELGCGDEPVMLDLWRTAVAEHAERTVTEIDLDELRQARTLREFARCVLDACAPSPSTIDQGDEPL